MPTIFHNFRENINKDKEKEKVLFRFDDLNIEAQYKFVKLIKQRSSIYTVRNYDEEEIYKCLDMINPVIIKEGWNGGFSKSSIKKGSERYISLAIYKINRRRISEEIINSIRHFTETRDSRYRYL